MEADPTHLVPERVCERCGLPVPSIHECCPACLLNDLKLVANEYFDPNGSFGGRLVGSDFTMLEEIGRGGMGVVFRARQHSPSREVAIKVLLPHLASSPDIRRRLFAEAAAMAELNHPGILPLYASGEHEGQPWLAMKLAPGGSLATRRGEWVNDWRKAAELLAGLADAVQHAHERGLIHRDVKPGNVLFDETGRACLADFGLVKWLDVESSDTLSQAMLGTPAYLAPEVAKLGARSATTASDIYGLGAVLYELLTGVAPFKGASTAELLQRIMADDPPAPRRVKPEIPSDLEIICQKALSKEPGTRYASAANLGADLRRWLNGEMILARRFSTGERIVRWARRHPLPTVLTVALAAALLAGGGIVWSQNQSLKITNAQLDASVVEARKARTAAEDRVDYMTRELPSQLEPIGRLEVLNGVFENIEKYYDGQHPSRDAVGLARQAEFSIQWAGFLRPQGKGAEARQELDRAVQLGHHATQLPGGGPDVWRVYVSALRNRGGYATFDDDHELALESIRDALLAADTGLRLHPGDFLISVERADAMLGQAYSTSQRRLAGDLELTKTLLESSANEWASLLARRVADDKTNKRIRRQEAASQFHAGLTALDLRNLEGAVDFFRKCHAMLTSIATDSPGNFDDQLFLSSACNRIATTLILAGHAQVESPLQQEVEQLLAESEQISSALVARDGFNQRWRAEWGLSAQAMANLEHKREQYSEASYRWLTKALDRLEPVTASGFFMIHDARQWTHNYLADYHVAKAMPAEATFHRNQAVESGFDNIRANPSKWAAFSHWERLLEAAMKHRKEYESPEARLNDLIKWRERIELEASKPGASPWWQRSTAAVHRRMADVYKVMNQPEDEFAENWKAFRLRSDLLASERRAGNSLVSETDGVAKYLAEGNLSTPARIEMVQRLIRCVPAAAALRSDETWRPWWVDVFVSAVKTLDEPVAGPLLAEADAALFPDRAPRPWSEEEQKARKLLTSFKSRD